MPRRSKAMMRSVYGYPIIEGNKWGIIAETIEPVSNPEALAGLVLCQHHGEEVEEKDGLKFCKECGLMVMVNRG